MNPDCRHTDGGSSDRSPIEDRSSQADASRGGSTPRGQAGTHRRAWEGSQIRVQMADFLPVILQAAVDRSRWLEDFANEPILISRDFHEVLSNYNALRGERRRAG